MLFRNSCLKRARRKIKQGRKRDVSRNFKYIEAGGRRLRSIHFAQYVILEINLLLLLMS